MKTPILLITFCLIIATACNKQATDTTRNNVEIKAHLTQIDGCQRNNLQKTKNQDSCFTYTFNKDLIVDFCVTANCCPDSNRFIMDYTIDANTIQVTVVDTAENLCRCTCPYLIHSEFSDLPLNEVAIKVDYDNEIIYNIQISR